MVHCTSHLLCDIAILPERLLACTSCDITCKRFSVELVVNARGHSISRRTCACPASRCRIFDTQGLPPGFLQPGRQGGVRKRQKRFVPGCCIPCGGANLQQGPTTVKHDTEAPVQSPASSSHITPTPNQDDPSRHYRDVGNTLVTVFPPQPGRQGGMGKSQKRFVPGCCIPCGGANLQQGPTTVKSDTGASVQSPASSPHTTPTPNQDDPSRHCRDVGNTLATVFPSQLGRQGGVGKRQKRFVPGCCIPCGGANL